MKILASLYRVLQAFFSFFGSKKKSQIRPLNHRNFFFALKGSIFLESEIIFYVIMNKPGFEVTKRQGVVQRSGDWCVMLLNATPN